MRRAILFLLLVARGFLAFAVEIASFGGDAFHLVVAISVPEDEAKEGEAAFAQGKAFLESLEAEGLLPDAAISLVLASNDYSRLPDDLRPEVPEGAAEVISILERTGGAAILLLPEEEAGQTIVKCGVKGKTSSPELVSALITQLEGAGLSWRLEEGHLDLYRIGWVPESRILKAYFDAGVPAVALSTAADALPAIVAAARSLASLVQPDDVLRFSQQDYVMIKMPSFAAKAIDRLAKAFLGATAAGGEGLGRIPLAQVAGGKFVVLSERLMVSITVLFFSIFLLYTCVLFLSSPSTRKKRVRDFFKAIPFAALFVAVNFGTMRLGGSLASSLVEARFGKPEAWTLLPRAALLTKLLCALFLSSVVSSLRGRFHLLRDPVSIGYSATIAALINIVVFSVLEFSMSGYFILSYMIVFAYAHTKRASLQAALSLLALAVFGHLYAQVLNGNTAAISALYGNEGGWNLLAAFFALPFQLMSIGIIEKTASRLELPLRRRPAKKGREGAKVPIVPLLSLFLLAAAVSALLLLPAWSRERPLPVLIRESAAGEDLTVSLDSPVELKDVPLRHGQVEAASDSAILDTPVADFIGVEFAARDFLDRKVFELAITPRVRPRRIDIRVISDAGIAVSASPLPFKMDEGGREAIFSSGENPETPMQLSFITGTAASLRAEISCWSTDNPFGFYIDDESMKASNLLFVKKEINLFGED